MSARRYIGSTDVGPVMAYYRPGLASLAKYVTAADVWLRIVHGVSQPSSQRMERGLREEPRLRALYRDTVGEVSEPPGLIQHPDFDFIGASPDGLISTDGGCDYKTTSRWARSSWGEPGTDLVPDGYQTQMQLCMAVTGRKWWRVLVAFGVDTETAAGEPVFSIEETAIYEMERDDELCGALVECAVKFWREHVCTRIAPGISPLHNKRAFKRLTDERTAEV